jgi:hypothetical protein
LRLPPRWDFVRHFSASKIALRQSDPLTTQILPRRDLLFVLFYLTPTLRTRFEQNVMHVQFDGADAELQALGDFSVGKAFTDQTGDLFFARAKRRAHKVLASASDIWLRGALPCVLIYYSFFVRHSQSVHRD